MTRFKPPAKAGQTFTSWKLDIINALAADRTLSRGDLGVAICILHHVNERTKECYLSEQLIADEAALKSLRGVRLCIRKLERHRWVKIIGKGRGGTNRFSILDGNVSLIIDRLQSLKDTRDEARLDRKRRSPRHTYGAELEFLSTRNPSSSKHLS